MSIILSYYLQRSSSSAEQESIATAAPRDSASDGNNPLPLHQIELSGSVISVSSSVDSATQDSSGVDLSTVAPSDTVPPPGGPLPTHLPVSKESVAAISSSLAQGQPDSAKLK